MKYNWNNLTISQYQRLLQMPEEPTNVDVVQALTGKPRNKLTIREIKNIQVQDLTPKTDPSRLPLFVHKGVLYGMQKTSNIPFGLFVDLLDLSSDVPKFLPELTSYLYRPVVKINFWNTVKLRVITRVAPRVKSVKQLRWLYTKLLNVQYEIEEYDPILCETRVNDIKEWPATIGHHTSAFFLILSKVLQIDSLNSSKRKLREMMKTINQHGVKALQSMISQDGDGTPLFGDFPGKTPPKSNQS